MCYQCHIWNGLKEKCDEGHQIPINQSYNIPVDYTDKLKAAQGATETDFRKEHKLAKRKVA